VLLDSHECSILYASKSCLYRSRAAGIDFLANSDFDEVFFPNPSVQKGEGALLKLMEDLAAASPNAGSFYFERKNFPRQFPDDERLGQQGQIALMTRIMRKTTVAPGFGLAGKLVVIPERLDGLRTHWVREMVPPYEEV
jgi:hypothetical protein